MNTIYVLGNSWDVGYSWHGAHTILGGIKGIDVQGMAYFEMLVTCDEEERREGI